MGIVLERAAPIRLHQDYLRLKDPKWALFSNGTHMFTFMSLRKFETVMEVRKPYSIADSYHPRFNDPHEYHYVYLSVSHVGRWRKSHLQE